MSSESGRDLSMEALKILNMPQPLQREQNMQETALASTMKEASETASQQTEQSMPLPEVHPTGQEWQDLTNMLDELIWCGEQQIKLLERLPSRPINCATKEQADMMTKELTAIRTQLEQAGWPKERRFSLRLTKLHLPCLSPALLLIPVIAMVLWAVWSSWGTLWSAISSLLP